MKTPRMPAIFVLVSLLTCAEKITRYIPADPEYRGDYRIERTLASEAGFKVFSACTLVCHDAGDDKLDSFRISPVPELGIYPAPGKSWYVSGEPLHFTFIQPGVITFAISGKRHNDSTVSFDTTIMVVNPYLVCVDTGSYYGGDTVRFTVRDSTTDMALDSTRLALRKADFRIKWQLGDNTERELPFNRPFLIRVRRPETVVVSAKLTDNVNSPVALEPLRITIPSDSGPVVSIDETVRYAQTGKPCTIKATIRNGDSLVWTLSQPSDTIISTSTAYLTHVWTDSVPDTVTVYAKNRFGTKGSHDTVIIIPRFYPLDLEPDTFPSLVYARRRAVWRVAVFENGRPVPDSQLNYEWRFEPDTGFDRDTRGGTCELTFRDRIESFHVSVFACRDTDSTWTRTEQVTVIADKPVLELSDPVPDSVGLRETAVFLIKARDTNRDGDGRVAGVYYRIKDDTSSTPLTSDTLRYVSEIAGIRTLEFWCVDNEGFFSQSVFHDLHVTTDKPYFEQSSVEYTAYSGDPVRITAAAFAGNAGGTITEWLWDFDRDGSVELTTTADHFDTVFTGVRTVTLTVGCRDDRGDSAETLAVRVIRVSAGVPATSSITCAPRTLFRGDTVRVRVVASDPNGAIDSIFAGTDTSDLRRVAVTPAESVDTILEFIMNTTGTFLFHAAALDNDRLRSPLIESDSVTVKSGDPEVTGISPRSCWINDDQIFTVSAFDVDPQGSIVSCRVQWEPGGTWDTLSGLMSTHRYLTEGIKRIRAVVTDNRGDLSDTLRDSVVVKLGRPGITSIEIDTGLGDIYIRDERKFTLVTDDENDPSWTVLASWDGDTVYESSLTCSGDPVVFSHRFPASASGSGTIRFRVRDADGITADTTLSIEVKRGAPVIDSVTPREIWVEDSYCYQVYAHDPNGAVDSIRIKFDGAENWLVWSDAESFCYTWDTLFSDGPHVITVRVMDEDSVWSEREFDIVVKIGRPRVHAAGDTVHDTLFIPTSENGGYIDITAEGIDDNGSIARYYWDLTPPFNQKDLDNAITESGTYPDYHVAPGFVNGSLEIAVFAKDDDSLVGGDTFWVYPDGPPPAPDTVSPQKNGEVTTTAVKLVWKNVDVHDGDGTQYRIMLGSDTPPDDEAVPFTPGTEFTREGEATFSAEIPVSGGSGVKFWRVIARDARGSETAGPINWFIFNDPEE